MAWSLPLTRAIRWGRVVLAILLGELLPVLVLVAVVALYPAFAPPGAVRSPEAVAQAAGLFVGPIAGALVAFAVSWWAGRGSAVAVQQAIVIGLGVAVLDLGILVVAGEHLRSLFLLSNAGKLVAAILGGFVVTRHR